MPSREESTDAGVRRLSAYTVYENVDAMPRAFFVPRSKPLPDRRDVFSALSGTDFRQCVLLESVGPSDPPGPGQPAPSREDRSLTSSVQIRVSQPNRVILDVDAAEPGQVVLADPWFPGWTCTVDGEPVPVSRADFLFRSVGVGPGKHEVVFTFAPRSFARGKTVSLAALICVGLVLAGTFLRRRAAGTPL
jgi:hypothetical protein